MSEYLLDDVGVLNAGDDPHRTAAGRTGLDVDPEHPLEALRLRLIAARRSAGVRSSGSAIVVCGPPFPRLPGVTRARYLLFGANTPWNRVRLTRGFGTSAASRAIKSRGSKMTCVVPSRYGLFSGYRTLPLGVTDTRFCELAGQLMYRHSRSSFWR